MVSSFFLQDNYWSGVAIALFRIDGFMSNEKIRELLAKLHDEVQKAEVDADTRSSLQELDSDIHDLLDSSTSGQKITSVMERAKLLEADFAIGHPTVERFMREVIDTLAKIGV